MKKLFQLFDSLFDPIFVVNQHLAVVYCNEAAANFVDLSSRQILRLNNLHDIFQLEDAHEGLNNITTVIEPTPQKEIIFKTSNGREGKVQITIQPILANQEEKLWLIYLHDVTVEFQLQKKYRAEVEQKEAVISALANANSKLENYSKNLELMVSERTAEISQLNLTMSTLFNSLEQGFFIFNSEGKILNFSSEACQRTVECKPDGKLVWDVLRLPESAINSFRQWMETIFSELLPFNELVELGPKTLPHSKGRKINIEYYALRSKNNKIDGIVVVTSDVTLLDEARRTADQEKNHAKLIIHLVKSKREIFRFINEARTVIAGIIKAVNHEIGKVDIDDIFRKIHTIKGGASLFSITEVVEVCHQAEGLIADLKEKESKNTHFELQIKCAEIAERFSKFIQETEEILGSSTLNQERHVEISVSKLNEIAQKVATLPGGGPFAQSLLSEIGMEPIGRLLRPYGDVVAKLALKTHKKIKAFTVQNEDLAIIPEAYGNLISTLVHAYRNSVDHGIEVPSMRILKGKPPEGEITTHIKIQNSGVHLTLLFEIKDDGAGIDPEKIRQKLISQNLNFDKLTDFQILQHVFDDQFTTKSDITEISGRGIGLSAIRVASEKLGGRVWVESEIDKGTSLFIEVPYIREFKRNNFQNNIAA